jgi:palmitoyltransferase ZDHHC3/7/25
MKESRDTIHSGFERILLCRVVEIRERTSTMMMMLDRIAQATQQRRDATTIHASEASTPIRKGTGLSAADDSDYLTNLSEGSSSTSASKGKKEGPLCWNSAWLLLRLRGFVGNSIMSVAQRRGKGPEKVATVLVSDEQKINSVDVPLLVPSGSSDTPVRLAQVRRNFCGTGPFDKHWLNLDCCGLFCALVTYALHAYGVYAVTLILLPPWMSSTNAEGIRTISVAGFLHQASFTLIAVLAVISHFKAMTTDPGAVPPDAKPLECESDTLDTSDPLDASISSAQQERNYLLDPPERHKVKRLCRRCKSFKPHRAHHCSVCRRCIIKMDHHCPWVNNCVGIGNHKYFLLFVFYTFISCCYSLILVVSRFSTCGMGGGASGLRVYRRGHPLYTEHQAAEAVPHHRTTCLDRPAHLLTILGLLVEAILFGMFTACMMFDQADVVRSKVTHIDRFKGSDVGGALAGVIEVFGVGRRGVDTRFRPDWLSPFVRVCFPSQSMTDEVMGFCRPCRTQAKAAVAAAKAAIGSMGPSTTSGARPKGTVSLVEIL